MLRKRLRNDEDGELDEEEGKAKRGSGKKSKGGWDTMYHIVFKAGAVG